MRKAFCVWALLFTSLWATPLWMLPGITFLKDNHLIPPHSSQALLEKPLTRQEMAKLLLELSLQKEAQILQKVRSEIPPEEVHTNCGTTPLFPADEQEGFVQELIRSLSLRGIITLDPSGSFKPEKQASRYEMAVSLNRLRHFLNYFESCLRSGAEREPVHFAGRLPFEDVSPAHWAYPHIGEMYQIRVLQGVSSRHFGGEKRATMIQIGVALSRFLFL